MGNTLDLYHAHLIQLDSGVGRYRELLHEDEIARADRFVFDVHRRRFVMTRGILREILAGYLGISPRSVRFAYGNNGKPGIAVGENPIDLQFNVSHSEDEALIGVIQGARIGVDLEKVAAGIEAEKIARQFFSTIETTTLLALPVELRLKAFYDCWTRKEAYLKALGAGLAIDTRTFDVAFAPGDIPRVLSADQDEPRRWKMYVPPLRQAYVAAVVFEDQGRQIEYRQFHLPY
jgi:4'-phosphopantetheinyl transferase